MSLLITASALIREKEQGTIEQLLITPGKTWEVFLAKVIPTVVIIGFLSTMSLLLMVFFLVTCLYVFTVSALEITIATMVDNFSQAMMVILAILVPMLMISGAWTPPEAMHPVIRALSLLSPMRYYLEFGYGILLKGIGFSYLWKDVLGMIGVGGILFVISSLKFRQSFAK